MSKANCPVAKTLVPFHVDLNGRYKHDNHGRLQKPRSRALPEGLVQNIIWTDPPSPEDLMFLAWQHSIDEVALGNMVGEYFFPKSVPIPEIRYMEPKPGRTTMQDIITKAVTGKILFDYDENDAIRDSNSMTIEPETNVKPFYSAYLFKGILLLAPLTKEFHFYRAIDNGKFTVAIVAVGANDMVLYAGELSEFYP